MERILIVDDDPLIVSGIAEVLQAEGLRVASAFDRESAEALIRAEFFPVILADLRVRSEEDGLNLLEQIRALSPRSAVATITGQTDDVLTMRLRDLGARTVLLKPIDPQVMIAIVRELLGEIESSAALLTDDEFSALHAAVTPRLRSIACRRYALQCEDAEELIQQAWLLFFEKRAAIRASRAWLAGTVANLCKQEIAKRYRRRALESAHHAPSHSTPDALHTGIAVRQALSSLDDRGRELSVRIGLEQESYEEISSVMRLPIGSIGPMFGRAKAKMRKQLSAATA